MTTPDTSTEALHSLERALECSMLRLAIRERHMTNMRAIAAERDAAIAERNQWQANSRENKMIAESNLRERDAARADVAALREALEFYARDHERPSDGPWGYRSTDFGTVALAALVATKPKGTAT